MKKIYVGNLPWSISESELQDAFAKFGDVHSVAIIKDRETNRSRGFGFIEMSDDGAERAISEMDGQEVGGRPLRVNEAQERRGGPPRGGRGPGRG